MKRATGNVTWVKVSYDRYVELLREFKTLPHFYGKCGRHTILCFEMRDVQTGEVTFTPVRTIEEGRIEI